jgi:response regulator RpfG family c-di-GMP phosphodiesterase
MPIGPKGKIRILIIDKDTEFSDAVMRVLGVHHYEVMQTKSFLKALDSCYEFMPHLILLDLVQETPEAIAFLKELNSLHDFVKAPVLLTGFQPKASDVKMAVSLGAQDFLKKPLHNRTLISKIKKLTLDKGEKELKTISPYTTQATVKIKITHQLENLLSIESPLRIRGKKHCKLILKGQRALEASTVSTINTRTKNNEYKNILAFDPLEGNNLLAQLEDLNLIYHLEDLLAEDKYSLLVMGPDMEGLDLLKILLKKFNATFALSKEVNKYKSKDLVNYDSILFGYSGTKKD